MTGRADAVPSRPSARRHGVLAASTVLVVAAVVAFAPRWWWQLATGFGDVLARHPLAIVLLAAGLLGLATRATTWWRGPRPAGRRPVADRLPLFAHVTLLLLLATAVAAVTGLLLWRALGSPRPAVTGWSVQNTLDAVKVVLAVVAGIGGVVALTVSYRKQAHGEAAEHRENTKLFTERFGRAADQLGAAGAPVRLAGAYAMARLADDWDEGRQTCVDVLCAYLRVPPADAEAAERQVRQTLLRLLRDHLRSADPGRPPRWQGGHFDLTGADLGDAELGGLRVAAGTTIVLTGCTFTGTVALPGLRVSDGGAVLCTGARLAGGTLTLDRVVLTGGLIGFDGIVLDGGALTFRDAEFRGGTLSLTDAQINVGDVVLDRAVVAGGAITFADATLAGGRVSFDETSLTAGTVTFADAALLDGSAVTFDRAALGGADVTFDGTRFYGGRLDLAEPVAWTTAPTGVRAGVRGVRWPTPTHLAALP